MADPLPLILLAGAPLLQGGSAPPAEVPAFAGLPEQDFLSYTILVRADPAGEGLSGSCAYRVRAAEPLTAVRLHALDGPEWRVSFHDEAGRPLPARRVPGGLLLELPEPVPAGREVGFHAVFSGRPVDGLYREDNRYGRPVVFTDHFSSRARGWLPCEDHPSDRAAFDLWILHPAGSAAVGSGRWEDGAEPPVTPACGCPSADPEPGWEVSHGRTVSDLPTYQLAFAVGPYARAEEGGDPRLVPHYLWRRDLARARRGLGDHAAWMERMEQTFGPYAYAKYCVVQVPTRWGGMENAGNTWVMESLFDGRDGGAGTLAHEFAHMWFGDAVGYAEWWEAWLSEGFASYFGPWLHAATGGPPLERELERARRTWLASAAGRRLPIRWRSFRTSDDFFSSSSVNTYQKGAWVLHMLRGEVGDGAFFAGIRAWYRSNLGRAVTTAELRAAMEQAAGRDLGWFFEQWLDRPGCPELSWKWLPDGCELRQVQDGPPYRFWIRLAWTGADGARAERRYRVEEATTRLPLPAGYRAPVVDPRVELLYRRG
ncbi:MAG: hypothetical protein D6702_11605 [Planctomycetota bacterium]|nr:MAG: hypothetical protein D6702_11605 [Planctomycetota bacterium]